MYGIPLIIVFLLIIWIVFASDVVTNFCGIICSLYCMP